MTDIESTDTIENQAPVIAQLDDIDPEFATRAFNGTSFSPEKRGDARRAEYVHMVNGLYAELWPLAKTEEQKALLGEEMERYRQGYLTRMKAYLASHANVASTMIAGPARFPTVRNQKRSQWADNKASELYEWEEKARAAIKRKLLDSRPADEKEAAAWRLLAIQISRSLGFIEKIDRGEMTYCDRAAFVNSIAGKVERLAANGEAAMVDKALELVRTYNAGHEKPAITDRHKFWSFGELARDASARAEAALNLGPEIIAKTEDVELIADPAADRMIIKFAEKPSDEIITRLHAEGWKWSRRSFDWRRKLTEAAKDSARRLVGAA